MGLGFRTWALGLGGLVGAERFRMERWGSVGHILGSKIWC
jgi:hypothetical protein